MIGRGQLSDGTYISFNFGNLYSVLLKSYEEFLGIDLSVSVNVINFSESSAETSDCGRASSSERCLDSFDDY